MEKKYWSGSQTKHRVKYHIVWTPKYRKRILDGKLAERLKELLEECIEVNRWAMDEISIQKDHIHLLIQFVPSISISEMVQILKGGTSRVIREEFPELKEFLWGSSLWADGYFVESVGSFEENIIQKYIQNQ
jgi:putative transposase